jgi:hypothetical protein
MDVCSDMTDEQWEAEQVWLKAEQEAQDAEQAVWAARGYDSMGSPFKPLTDPNDDLPF